ncbi:MAG: type II secretion system F family protein [Paracoccaceae bacterium]
MEQLLVTLQEYISFSSENLILASLAFGILFLVLGLNSVFSGPTPEELRIRAISTSRQDIDSTRVLRLDDNDPGGVLRAFVPRSQKERSTLARRLRQAGIHHENAVAKYFLARTFFGMLLPAIFIGLLFLPTEFPLPELFRERLHDLTSLQVIFVMIFWLLVGFFAPTLWVKTKIDERRLAIEQALPNALDLLTVAVEAGLGFDSAMTRIAHELQTVAPEIAEEFTILQLELQAGKDRQSAFTSMADRVGVGELSAFSNVIVQSMQFGTSISKALTGYANEMRLTRELKAQEMANKLPVKMSAVLAGLMMPVLLLIVLTPILIRWIRVFGDVSS